MKFFHLLEKDVFTLKKVVDHLLDNREFYRNAVDWETDGKRLKSIAEGFDDFINEIYNEASDHDLYERMNQNDINSNIQLGME
jgi:hypothetical protein